MSCFVFVSFFFFDQKTAYEMRISDWSSDVCSSDLVAHRLAEVAAPGDGDLMLAAAVVNDADELFVRQQRAAQQHRLGDVELIVGQRDQQGARRRRIARQDRKSTRLNSSH